MSATPRGKQRPGKQALLAPALNCQTLPGLLGEVLSTHLASLGYCFVKKKKGQQPPAALLDPALLVSVVALPSADTLRPAPATAALLNASGSEDSHRGPNQQA
jgi:hypothetical protein